MKFTAFKFLIAGAALVIGLGGCTQVNAAEQTPAEDINALKEGQTELYGKIRTAFGNEIQLVIGTPMENSRPGGRTGGPSSADDTAETETSAAGDAPAEGGTTRQRTRPQSGEGAEGTGEATTRAGGGSGAATTTGSPAPAGDAVTVGGNVATPTGSTGGSTTNRGGAMISAITLEYTGEEKTFQIPVTATITSGQGENAKNVRFTQLAEKNIVRLVLGDAGQIVSVQVLG